MTDSVKKPKWYVRNGLECYEIITYMLDLSLQKQDLDKANETWNSFYEEASKRFHKYTPIMPDEWIDDSLHDED